MTTAAPSQPPILLVAAVFVASFASGFWTSRLTCRDRVEAEVQQRLDEFILFADRLGVLDRQRLEEAAIAASESEWEDIDAAQRAGGGAK